jgi:hypothetical protein
MKKNYIEIRRRGIFYVQQRIRKANWIAHIWRKSSLL